VKILEAAARKTILGVLLLLLRELRHLNRILEVATDSFRIAHKMQAQFTVAKDEPSEDPDAETRIIPRYEHDEPQYLKLDLIECLCREQHIPIEPGTDLFAVARERQWIDEAGQLVVLPTTYLD